jgi:hypothetical protein
MMISRANSKLPVKSSRPRVAGEPGGISGVI